MTNSKKNPVGRPRAATPRKPIFSLRGSDEFRDWFQRLVEHARMPESTLIEHALIAFAERENFGSPPPKR